MNSFETDLNRAIGSRAFVLALVIQFFILWKFGIESEMFRVSVPITVTFPYSTAWLTDYQNGFIKQYLPRCGMTAYIIGKFLACGISGGAVLSLTCVLYQLTDEGKEVEISLFLMFLSGMLWACVSATLAVISNNRYIAYGGSFVLYYVLIILYERYFDTLYCLYPVEWYHPKHVWVFEEKGIIVLCSGILFIVFFLYDETIRRRLNDI